MGGLVGDGKKNEREQQTKKQRERERICEYIGIIDALNSNFLSIHNRSDAIHQPFIIRMHIHNDRSAIHLFKWQMHTPFIMTTQILDILDFETTSPFLVITTILLFLFFLFLINCHQIAEQIHISWIIDAVAVAVIVLFITIAHQPCTICFW